MANIPLLLNTGTGAAAPAATLALSEESPRTIKRFGPSNLIVDQVPDFINRDHEGFRSFVEAYYEWMERNLNPFGIIDSFMDMTDVDTTIGLFVLDFREMYLKNFPLQLATDSTGNIVSEANFLKNARNFYGAKGTEKSFKFLFRLIYNAASEVYYPGNDVLKASDGRWIEKFSLKTTNTGGTANFQMAGHQVVQINPLNGDVIAYAEVADVIQYRKEYYDINEIFIKNKFGTFLPNLDVYVDTSSGRLLERVYPVISGYEIVDGGLRYSRSDVVTSSTSYNGFGLELAIDSVKENGKITGVQIIDSGIGYDQTPTISIASNTGNGLARVNVTIGAVTSYPGYFATNSGKLSSNKKLYDADYYQEFAYALRSEVPFLTYKEIYKKLVHPAGFKMFGDVLIKRDIVDSLPFHSEMQRYELPFIGHYTPYRIGTTADLYNKYVNGFNPRGNSFSSYQAYGQSGGKLLVTPVGFTFNGGVTWSTIAASGSNGNLISASVFEFQRVGATQGAFYLKQIDFDTTSASITGGGFVEGITFTLIDSNATGYTATIQRVLYGIGIVPETSAGQTHDPQGLPLGSSGSIEGYIQAQGFSYAYWRVYHHPNIRGIKGLTGPLGGGTGLGASFGSVALNPFFRMPIGYHFHSNPNSGPYEGTTGDDNQYGLIESTTLTSPNF
jgi:hypothetical protein